MNKKIWGTQSFWFDVSVTTYLVFIAGLFSYGPSEEQLLNLRFLYLSSLFCAGLGLTVALSLYSVGAHTLGRAIFDPIEARLSREPKPFLKTFWGWQLIVLVALTLIVGIRATEANLYELFDVDGFAGAKRIFGALLKPNWSILSVGILAIVETIFIAFMATILAVPVAFFLAFFAAKNIASTNSVLNFAYYSLRTFLNVTRSIEPLIWAIIFSVWVGIGPFAGMLALMFHSISSLTKQYSEIIECVEEGPIEGVKASGANPIQVVWFAIVPQIVLPYISFTIYRWDINVRMATVIGLVGGGGIGTLLIQYQGQGLWHEVGTLALLIVVVVWVMDIASAQLRDALK